MEIIAFIALCLVGQGLFEGAEMVLVSADRNRLKERASRNERGAKLALSMLARHDRILATTLTTTNIFIVLGSIIVTSCFIKLYGRHAEWLSVCAFT
ncbi:MAG: DUF21 domain-containing protein, partial [Syntrophorhabdaceae bacterium]|nr:DUF21 domain-containing protein [Syntrophorhabdaceae bacterium]